MAFSATYYPFKPFSPSAWPTDVQAIFSAMDNDPDTARKIIISETVSQLQAEGIWSKADSIMFMAAADEQAALLDWKSLRDGSWTEGDGAFLADSGFTHGAEFSRLSAPYNPADDGVNFQLDSACMAVLVRNYSSVPLFGQMITCGTSPSLDLQFYSYVSKVYGFVNSVPNTPIEHTTSNPDGLWILQRTAPDAVAAYVDGSAAGTSSEPSDGIPDALVEIGCNSSGTNLPAEFSFFYAGTPLDATERTALQTIVNNYLAALAGV